MAVVVVVVVVVIATVIESGDWLRAPCTGSRPAQGHLQTIRLRHRGYGARQASLCEDVHRAVHVLQTNVDSL